MNQLFALFKLKQLILKVTISILIYSIGSLFFYQSACLFVRFDKRCSKK